MITKSLTLSPLYDPLITISRIQENIDFFVVGPSGVEVVQVKGSMRREREEALNEWKSW